MEQGKDLFVVGARGGAVDGRELVVVHVGGGEGISPQQNANHLKIRMSSPHRKVKRMRPVKKKSLNDEDGMK